MALEDLRRHIRHHQALGAPGEPLVGVDAFFEGNTDAASIGPNLEEHPGVEAFAQVLRGLRQKPGVNDVQVRITDAMLEDGDAWPFTDTVFVVGAVEPEDVAAWTVELQPTEVYEVEPEDVPGIDAGAGRVFAVWWD